MPYSLCLLIGIFAVFVTVRAQNEMPPNLTRLPPNLSFSCNGKKPGFYADDQTECQAYHICSPYHDHSVFLCGPGTIFNQKYLICDLPSNYNCADASKDADIANAHAFQNGSSTNSP